MGGQQQGAGGGQEGMQTLLGLVIEAAIPGPESLIHGQAVVAAGGEYGKKQTGCHALAVGLDRQVNEIPEARKLHDVSTEGLKTTQAALHQQVVGLDGLQPTELRAGDEAFVNHREDGHPRLKVAGGVLIDPGDQPQEGALAGTVVADQGDPLPFPHHAVHILESRDDGTATATFQHAAGDRTDQGGFKTAGFRGQYGNVQPHVTQLEYQGALNGRLGTGVAGDSDGWRMLTQAGRRSC